MAPIRRPALLPFAAFAVSLVVAWPAAHAAPPTPEPVQFTATDLGTLGGAESHAYFINKVGQVAGISRTAAEENHVFLWSDGIMADLGLIDGGQSSLAGLNDRGQVVGNVTLPSGESRAFLWSDGMIIDLGTLPDGTESRAQAINNRGQVVGWSNPLYVTHAFLWEDGEMIDLGTLGGSFSSANLINDAGQVAGQAYTADSEPHAFLWDHGRMIDLSPGLDDARCGCFSYPNALNDRGQVVGTEAPFIFNPPVDTILWDHGSRTVILSGASDSLYRPRAINDKGEVAGDHVNPLQFGVMKPFFWHDGILQEWSLGGTSSQTMAMNKFGQVIGEGRNAVGQLHGFSWSAGMVTDFRGTSTRAADVNERGLVVGSAFFPGTAAVHAALWSPVGKIAPPRVAPGTIPGVEPAIGPGVAAAGD